MKQHFNNGDNDTNNDYKDEIEGSVAKLLGSSNINSQWTDDGTVTASEIESEGEDNDEYDQYNCSITMDLCCRQNDKDYGYIYKTVNTMNDNNDNCDDGDNDNNDDDDDNDDNDNNGCNSADDYDNNKGLDGSSRESNNEKYISETSDNKSNNSNDMQHGKVVLQRTINVRKRNRRNTGDSGDTNDVDGENCPRLTSEDEKEVGLEKQLKKKSKKDVVISNQVPFHENPIVVVSFPRRFWWGV